MDIRRVVTGHSADGKAVFASDEMVAPAVPMLMPSAAFHRLWGGDVAPTFPDDGSEPSGHQYFPPVGGFRFGLFTLPPDSTAGPADLDLELALADLEQKLPGMMQHMEPDTPGMHTTATIDFEYVISGEVYLELDDGAEVFLKAGDTVVQNGTRHAWHNRGSVPCTMVLFCVGAHHRNVP